VRHKPRPGPKATRLSAAAAVLLPFLLAAMIGGAVPASADGDDEGGPLAPRRVFDQSRPAVELVSAEFTARLSVPEPRVTPARQRELQAHVVDKIERGEIPATTEAARNAVIEELAKDPFRWFSRSGRVHEGQVKISAIGSGFSVSADGYIVTNAHVVAPRDEDLKATFLRSGLQEQPDDSIRDMISGGLTQSLATKYTNALMRWLSKMSTMSRVQRKLEAVSSSGTGGVSYPGGRPAKLVAASKQMPGKDVAIIKVDAKDMATVQLGSEAGLSTGDRLFVLGFPGPATFNPVLSKDSQKEPTLTQGVLSAKKTLSEGSTVLQTDAGMTHGNSGGPVFDERGKVVGVATFGSVDPLTGREVAGLNFAVPAAVVSELLAKAAVKPVEGTATERYRLALDAYDKHWYKRALPLFRDVKRLDPSHPSVERLIKESETGIAQGRDRTPREILGLSPLSLAVLVVVSGLVLPGVVLVLTRRRRAAQRHGRGAVAAPSFEPEPAFQGMTQPMPWVQRGLTIQPEPTGQQQAWVRQEPTVRREPVGWGPAAAAPRSDGWPGEPANGTPPAWRPPAQPASAPAQPAAAAVTEPLPTVSQAPDPGPDALRCGNCGRRNPRTNRFCEACWGYLLEP
jgi:serine protease Do